MAENKRTYSAVKAEIEKLQQEAESLRAAEIESVLADVRQKVAEYGFTERDVFGRKGRKSKSPSATPASAPPKYQDPKSGATWTGRGRAPTWIANARNRDRFLIQQ